MRDTTPIFAILGIIAFAMIPLCVRWGRSFLVGWFRAMRWGFVGEKVDKVSDVEAEARVALAIEKGTHIRLDSGQVVRKCRHCPQEATRRALKWERDGGIIDLIRRAFGAPGRVRAVVEPFGDEIYCESHAALAHEEYRIELAKYESERAAHERDWEVRRARFQQTGVHDRLDDNITKHDLETKRGRRGRKSEQTAKVVPFSGRSTGTE